MSEPGFLSELNLDGTLRPIKDSNAVSYAASQELTSSQKALARTNIGAGTSNDKNFVGTVDEWETLSNAEKDAYDTVDLKDDFDDIPAYDELTTRMDGLASAMSSLSSDVNDLSGYVLKKFGDSVSITSTTQKTYRELLTDIVAAFTAKCSTIADDEYLEVTELLIYGTIRMKAGAYYKHALYQKNSTPGSIDFIAIGLNSATSAYIYYADCAATPSNSKLYYANLFAGSFVDDSNTSVAASKTLTIFFNQYKKIT